MSLVLMSLTHLGAIPNVQGIPAPDWARMSAAGAAVRAKRYTTRNTMAEDTAATSANTDEISRPNDMYSWSATPLGGTADSAHRSRLIALRVAANPYRRRLVSVGFGAWGVGYDKRRQDGCPGRRVHRAGACWSEGQHGI